MKFKNRIFLFIILLLLLSCVKKKEEIVLTDNDKLYPKYGVINTDCNYYNKYTIANGRLTKGESIIILNGYFENNFIDNNQNYYIDVAIEVKLPYYSASIWVQERYIDYYDNEELFTSWFKNKLLVAEYYYTGTPEDIFNNDWYSGKEDREDRLITFRAFYSKETEDRLRISGNYFIIGHGGRVTAYRLESVVKDRNIYTLYLSDRWYGEIEVIFVDNGDGITITKYNIIKSVREDIINKMLNIKYVPYDKDKSEKTEASVLVWSNEQLKIIGSTILDN